jgi:hypothetical protein
MTVKDDRCEGGRHYGCKCEDEGTYGTGFTLSYSDGKAVQEVLRRYQGELTSERESLQLVHEETWQVQKDINYIEGLAKLFD